MKINQQQKGKFSKRNNHLNSKRNNHFSKSFQNIKYSKKNKNNKNNENNENYENNENIRQEQDNVLKNSNKNHEELFKRPKSKSDSLTKKRMINDLPENIIYKVNNQFLIKKKRHKTKSKNTFESEIKYNNIFLSYEKTLKIKFKNIYKDTITFENLKYISLDDISSLFNAWRNISNIYKAFEEELLKKNDLEIDKKTLKIISKNEKACKMLNDQKFWILYIEYLINENLLLNEDQFISMINEAFTYMFDNGNNINDRNKGYQFNLLKIYYLYKIKKFAPCFLDDGTLDDNDDHYIEKLDKSVVGLIKMKNNERLSYKINN